MMRRSTLAARTMGDFPATTVARLVIVSLAALHLAEGLSPVRYSPRTGLAYRRKPPPPGPPPSSPLLQSRRLEAIDSWINNIKSRSRSTNSISPSWNGKSPYKVIGVGGLPLQNEEDSVPVSARRGPETAPDFSPSQKAKYGGGGGAVSTRNIPYPPSRPSRQSRPHLPPQSSFRHKSARLRPLPPLPKRLPPKPKSGRRPPPMMYDERELRRPPPPLPQKYPSTKYPSTKFPTSRRGPLYPSPASAVGRKLPQQPLFREDFQNSRYRGRPSPKDSGAIDLAKRMPSKKASKEPSPTKSSENSRMEPDDFPKFPSAAELPSIAPTTASKPFSSTFEPPSFDPPTFESPKDFGPSENDAKDFGFGPPEGMDHDFNGFKNPSDKFKGFDNPFRHEEADDFPLQSFEGPPRVKPKFQKAPTYPPPPQKRYPVDLDVNLGIPPPPPPHRPKRPPHGAPPPSLPGRPKRYPPSFKPRPNKYPKQQPTPFKANYRPKNDFLSPDGVFDEDTEAEFKLFGDDGSPIKSGPPVDFEFEASAEPGKGRRPHRPPPSPHRPHHPPPPPPKAGRRPRPPPPPSRPRFTTQRPIPTPGPEDFPSPPPRPPTPPPTHPTHPPRITHPPEHYNMFTENPVDAFFDGDGQDVKLGPGNPFHGGGSGSGEIDSFASSLGSSSRRPPPPRPRAHMRPPPPPQQQQHHFPSEDSRSSFRPPPPPRQQQQQNPFGGGAFEDDVGTGFQVPGSLRGIEARPGRPGSFEDPFKGFRGDVRSSGRPNLSERDFDHRGSGGGDVGGGGGGDAGGGEEGFFEIPEGFPSLMTLGAGFESMKIRNKRSAQEPLIAQERRFTPNRRRRRMRNQHQQQLRYGYAEQDRGGRGGGGGGGYGQRGPSRRQQSHSEFGIQDGFWDEVETDFFSPAFGQRQQPYRNRNRGEYGGDYERAAEEYGYRQQRPSRGDYNHYSGGEENYKRVAVSDDRDNEILGSGNFDVIKGGTFYDPGTYYNLRYNTRPKQHGGGGGYDADFLDNFRDFADIKNDHIRRRGGGGARY